MRRVVFVAPCFAPSSYPPAIRAKAFASNLPEFGWQPIVLTVLPEFYEEPLDGEFLTLVPKELEIIRSRAIRQQTTRRFRFGDIGLRSFPFHLRALAALCRNGVDALVIPGPPWYPFCLGPLVRRRFGVPYVLDYIDPWVHSVGAEARLFSKAWASHRVALALEGPVVRRSAAVVAVSEGTNELVRERCPEMSKDHFTAIPYGFEPSDFEALRREHKRSNLLEEYSGCLNVCYVGAMLPKAYGTLRALFRALQMLRQSLSAAGRLRLHFVGTTYAVGTAARPLVLPVANEEGVGDLVIEHPERIAYLEALRLLLSADLLLAFGSSERHYTASKIFPCLLARRPLLAIFHEASSVCGFLQRAGTGRLITYGDENPAESRIAEIAAALGEFLHGSSFRAEAEIPEDVLGGFHAREMTRRLAVVLDRAVK